MATDMNEDRPRYSVETRVTRLGEFAPIGWLSG
jgi:hypothetical protein